MSTTIKNHPVSQLFVHGEHDIYAKSRNGHFYPARSIENRHDGEVKFADGSRKLLSEKNLTWLRFWDVPAERPANNSLTQGTVFISNDCDGEVTQFVDEGSAHETKRSSSFSLIKSSDGEDDVRLVKSSWPSLRSSTTKEQPHCAHQRVVPVHTQPLRMAGPQNPRDATQQRSSVLRLNRKTLAKEILRNNMVDLTSSSLPSSRKRSMNTDVHPTLSNQSMAKYMKNGRSNFDFGDRSLMRNDTQIFERYADREHERHYESEDEYDARGAIMKSHVIQSAHSSARYPGGPYQSVDWYETPNINQSASTPPTHSSNFTLSLPPGRLQDFEANSLKLTQAGFTSQLPHVGHQPESKMRFSSGIRLGRKRLKDNAKKCRKMYGIINRHLWCTQCKWKKACSRFKE